MTQEPAGAIDTIGARALDSVLAANPLSATFLGFHEHDERMPDVSEEADERASAAYRSLAEELAHIDVAEAPLDARVAKQVVAHQLCSVQRPLAARMREFELAPHGVGPVASVLHHLPRVTLAQPQHARAYLERCRSIPPYLEAFGDRLVAGAARGRSPLARHVHAVLDQIDANLAAPADEDPLVTIDAPAGWDRVDAWRSDVAGAVREHVRPALQALRDTLDRAVAPAGHPDEQAGLVWLDDGEELYADLAAIHTSTDLSVDAIHELGRDIVAELADEYRDLAADVLGSDDLALIFSRLRDDPSLRFDTRQEVAETAEAALRRAERAVPEWFGRLPDTPCVVREIADHEAPESTIAYYQPPAVDGSRPGTYWVNTWEPTTRTRFESEVLAFHEAVPGHHTQIALAQELDLPPYRRVFRATAHVEGWALYTERLAADMGLYSSDLARLGVLSFDSWRACRLVVDTGLHARGWSRQQAVDYLLANSPQAANNIENEVDRYITRPGQALAYMVGRRRIEDLRERAEEQIGDRFDVCDFHDVVLGHGSPPLPALDHAVDDWLATRDAA